ncbi:MAG: hypothetical protein RBU29_12820, partial [bacterium]|nr:hypothetical protein [bacterium]
MDSFRRLFFCGLVLCLWIGYTQAQPISFPFTNATPAENGVTVIGAGFGSIPAARVTFGPIPTADTYEGATDGYGMIIQANPGEGVMILTNPIQTDRCALIRCAIRASAAHVSAYIATIDQGQDIFVSTITTNNSQYFLNRYNRLAGVFMPPSTGFQG